MPLLSGPISETRELTVLTSDVLSLTVKILQTLRAAEQLQPLPPFPLGSAAASVVAVRCRRARGTWRRKPFEVADEVALARARVE